MEVLSESQEKIDLDAAFKESALKRRRLLDHIATVVVTFGGLAIILSIIAIIFFIGVEAVPLWERAKSSLTNKFDLDKNKAIFVPPTIKSSSIGEEYKLDVMAVGVEQFREIAYAILNDGTVNFISLEDGGSIKNVELTELAGKRITSVSTNIGNELFTLGTEDGYVLPIRIKFNVKFDEEQNRILTPNVIQEEPLLIEPAPIIYAVSKQEDLTKVAVAYTATGKLIMFVRQQEAQTLFGGGDVMEFRVDLTKDVKRSNVTALTLDKYMHDIYAGTDSGFIYNWKIRNDKQNPELNKYGPVSEESWVKVTALDFLLGGRSLIVGDSKGNVSTWFKVKDESNNDVLKQVHRLASHDYPVTDVAASPREKGLISADSNGNIILNHSTSEKKLLEIQGNGEPIKNIIFGPKADGILALSENNNLYNYDLENEHPETNFKTLFAKVWYEGYPKPEYVWQSTGGTDDFEPKISLTPLIFGTLKGAFYALIFAIPIAVLGAICVSQFMHPSVRNIVKPIVEIMAALPSVVLGFFAGLWMAPILEKYVPALFTMPVIITLLTLLSVYLWQFVPVRYRKRFKEGNELFLLIPVIVIGILISLYINIPVENLFFGGNYKTWLFEVMGWQFDQRNALVIGYAMGFAVIPIIFTISEDALSSVPKNLTAGSLALGANRWETAIKIVLPTASAGIFSAIMIGLGRAVGETMIVLMATGNTPIMDWNIFNGFRTLSANIAVEIPEAPHGGTLYRVLFLSALLLFAITFILNTAAELVRQRLRKKYGRL